MAGILFIISAPSGSGKSTLVSQLRSMVEGLEFSVSFTTRALRGSETDGREYHFISKEKFQEMIAAGDFLEWAEVFGNFYGTARSALEHAREAGKDLLLDIDVQGAAQVMNKLPEAVSIFVLPPSPEVLEKRLLNRSAAENMTDKVVLKIRLDAARNEVKQVWKYKYAIINDVLEDAASEMRSIVLYERGKNDDAKRVAQSCRTDAASEKLRAVLRLFE